MESDKHMNDAAPKPVSRQELYDLAWEEPMLRIAKRFDVSSSYLARVCTEMRVPRPAPGYWAQREVGKSPPRPALPTARPGDVTEWLPGVSVGTTVRSLARQGKDADQGRSKASPKTHELLAGVRPLFLKTRKVENGILRPFKRLLVDIVCSEAKLDDALSAAQSLFEALEKRGYRVCLARGDEEVSRPTIGLSENPIAGKHYPTRWSPDHPTVVHVGETAIGLCLFETTEEVETVYIKGDFVPVRALSQQQLRRYQPPYHWRSKEQQASGRLCLQAYSRYGVKWSQQWRESSSGKFRGMISEIVDALEAAAPDVARQVHEAKLHAAEELRKRQDEFRRWEEESERARIAKANDESRTELLKAIAAWDEARRVQDYFDSVEATIARLPSEEAALLRERLALCQDLVGPLDPLAGLKSWKSPSERLAVKHSFW